MRIRIQPEQQLADAGSSSRIEISRRLVREQHSRPRHKGSRKCDTLLLATGELSGVVACAGFQADPLEGVEGCTARIRSRCQLQGKHDIFERGQRRNEMKGLKNEPHTLGTQACPPILIEASEIRSFEQYTSAGRQIEPRQQR